MHTAFSMQTHTKNVHFKTISTTLLITCLSFNSFVTARYDNNHNDFLGAVGAVAVAAVAGGALMYGACKISENNQFESAQRQLRNDKDSSARIGNHYATQLPSDETLIKNYGHQLANYRALITSTERDVTTLTQIQQRTDCNKNEWLSTRYAADFVGDAAQLSHANNARLQTVQEYLRYLRAKAPLIGLAHALRIYAQQRAVQIVYQLTNGSWDDVHRAIRTHYAASPTPYRTAWQEYADLISHYEIALHNAERENYTSNCSQSLMAEAFDLKRLCQYAQANIAQTREYADDQRRESDLRYQEQSLKELRKQADAAERAAAAEQQRASAESQKAQEYRRSNDLAVQDMALRGAEMIAHSGCRSRESSLRSEIDRLEREIKRTRETYAYSTQEQLRKIQAEIASIQRTLTTAPVHCCYNHTNHLDSWRADLVHRLHELEAIINRV